YGAYRDQTSERKVRSSLRLRALRDLDSEELLRLAATARLRTHKLHTLHHVPNLRTRRDDLRLQVDRADGDRTTAVRSLENKLRVDLPVRPLLALNRHDATGNAVADVVELHELADLRLESLVVPETHRYHLSLFGLLRVLTLQRGLADARKLGVSGSPLVPARVVDGVQLVHRGRLLESLTDVVRRLTRRSRLLRRKLTPNRRPLRLLRHIPAVKSRPMIRRLLQVDRVQPHTVRLDADDQAAVQLRHPDTLRAVVPLHHEVLRRGVRRDLRRLLRVRAVLRIRAARLEVANYDRRARQQMHPHERVGRPRVTHTVKVTVKRHRLRRDQLRLI